MMMLISKAALMRRFRIVEIVTILQQTGLSPIDFATCVEAQVNRSAAIRGRPPGRRLAEDLGKV
jgi:hypothetical protein